MTVVRPYINGSTAFLLAIAGLALVGMVALDPPSARTPGSTILLYASCGVASIGLLSQGVFRLWWQKSIRLCESGVLWDRTLLYWTHVTGHRWSASGVLELRGTDQNGAETQIEVAVPPESRDTVEQLVETKRPRAGAK